MTAGNFALVLALTYGDGQLRHEGTQPEADPEPLIVAA
jgi:hypothetical protein